MSLDHSPTPIAARLTAALADRYRIEREAGRGGMATVYLARDLRHDRLVALKVLDPELGAVLGADRFLSEIRVTANLQHPNLLPLFDSGQADGLLFYVMPFVEGDSLRVRLEREKQLPVDDAVRIATAVANALDYAHSHGVIHRDLKPENILLQHGQPVVADFGIALAVSNAGGTRVTQTGLSLGTPQYMSPEQATGDRVIDGRTDIYSLAAMTYEMLTGEPPHTGTSAQAIIAKLMTTVPQPVRVLRPTVPNHVAMAVECGLAKLPADRFATAREFAQALTNPAFTTGVSLAATPQPTTRDPRLATALGALAAISTIAALWGWLRPQEPKQVLRYELGIDSMVRVIPTGRWGRAALSPDGSMLVYVGGPRNGLLLRRRDQLEATPIPGADQVGGPAFSPDGKRIAFIQNARTLMVVGLDGSPPVAVTDSLIGTGGLAWAGNDTIYVDGNGRAPLVKVAAQARAIPQFVAPLDTALGEIDQVYPEVLPDGAVLYTMQRTGANHAIAVLDPRTGQRQALVENARRPRYADGHLLYVLLDGVLMAVPFDARSHKVNGTATVVASGFPTTLNAIDYSVSRSGALSYISSPDGAPERQLVWIPRQGQVQVLDSAWRSTFTDPAISPDGTRIAVADGNAFGSPLERSDIWVRPIASTARLRVTAQGSQNRSPVWTRDGKLLLYVSASATYAILENPADGSIAPVRRLESREPIVILTATPDAEWVVYQQGNGGSARLYAHRRGDSSAVRVFAEETRMLAPALSPDGRFLAFVSYEGGVQPAIFVAPFPNPGSVKWEVSDSPGMDPVWANSGKELFYRDPQAASMMSVSINTGTGLSVGAPKRLFPITGIARFAVAHDDSRFLVPRPVGINRSRDRLMMVENWVESLGAGRQGK